MTEIEVLKAARAFVDQPWKWTQGASARDVKGLSCHVEDVKAVCFCTLGAVSRALVVHNVTGNAARLVRRMFGPEFTSTVMWNDAPERTHAEVLAAFDAAIERGTA